MRPQLAGALVFLSALLSASVPADVQAGALDARAQMSARYFRAMLSADLEIDRKVGDDGALRILVVHSGDSDAAQAMAERVAARDAKKAGEPIRGVPVRVEIVRSGDAGTAFKGAAGVIIAEPLRKEQVKALGKLGVENHVIVYSPFEGDVENGVSGGLSIEAQVRPLINTAVLKASQISLRESFLKVAKVYP